MVVTQKIYMDREDVVEQEVKTVQMNDNVSGQSCDRFEAFEGFYG